MTKLSASALKALIATPILACRWRYLPLMAIYFAYGASSFSGIAESFFVKERLDLSAHAMMMIAVWLTLPWTVKVVFGQCVDSIPLWGSTRRAYIIVASLFMVSGNSLLMAGVAGSWRWVMLIAPSKCTLYRCEFVICYRHGVTRCHRRRHDG